jgi:hypothetical protein
VVIFNLNLFSGVMKMLKYFNYTAICAVITVFFCAGMSLGAIAVLDDCNRFGSDPNNGLWIGAIGTRAVNVKPFPSHGEGKVLEVVTESSSRYGYVYRKFLPRHDVTDFNKVSFNLFIEADTIPRADGEFQFNMFAFAVPSERMTWEINADTFALFAKRQWLKITLPWSTTKDVNDVNVGWAELAGASIEGKLAADGTFAKVALSEDRWDYASNYENRGVHLANIYQIEMWMGSSSGSKQFWYVDDIVASGNLVGNCSEVRLLGKAMNPDINKDCQINLLDYSLLAEDWMVVENSY